MKIKILNKKKEKIKGTYYNFTHATNNIQTFYTRDKILKNLDSLKAFSYLFRLFGNPSKDFDEYKTLFSYKFYCPEIGKRAIFSVSGSYHEHIDFIMYLRKNEWDKVNSEDTRLRFRIKFREWIKKNKEVNFDVWGYDKLSKGTKDKIFSLFKKYNIEKFTPEYCKSEAIKKDYFDFIKKQESILLDKFSSTNQEYIPKNVDKFYFKAMDFKKIKHSNLAGYIYQKADIQNKPNTLYWYNVLENFIESFLEPTNIRDVSINILGYVKDSDYYKSNRRV